MKGNFFRQLSGEELDGRDFGWTAAHQAFSQVLLLESTGLQQGAGTTATCAECWPATEVSGGVHES